MFRKSMLLCLLIFTTIILSACGEAYDAIMDGMKEIDEQRNPKETDELVEGLEVHFIDVGQGDSILMRSEKATILIDAGDWKGNEVVPYLESHGVENIDLAIGTHEHADHIGQLDDVLESFHVEEVWLPGNEHTSQTYERVLNQIHEQEIVYHEPRSGETYDIEDVVLEVFNPTHLSGNYNDDSIVIKATYGNISFMLTGDAEKRAESDMLEGGGDLQATILKAGHHGSNTSSNETFVKSVNPKVAILSYGKGNSYFHPHKKTLDTFKNLDIDMYGTASHGTIIIRTDGKTYNIDTEKDGIIVEGGD